MISRFESIELRFTGQFLLGLQTMVWRHTQQLLLHSVIGVVGAESIGRTGGGSGGCSGGGGNKMHSQFDSHSTSERTTAKHKNKNSLQ